MSESARDIRTIAIGGSAGALEVVTEVLPQLPADIPAAVVVCLHRHANSDGFLAKILRNHLKLSVEQPDDGTAMRHGTVYTAPPDRHLVVEKSTLRLSHGPRENMCRPSIDVTFRSLAVNAGPRSMGVILSGTLSDGAAGLSAIVRCGGQAIVQDPASAKYPEMPSSALSVVRTAERFDASRIAERLVEFAHAPVDPEFSPPASLVVEAGFALGRRLSIGSEDSLGQRSALSCPECNGPLWEIDDADSLRYRCHTGHAYSIETLEVAQAKDVERSMWVAMRTLRERAETLRRLAQTRTGSSVEYWQNRASEADDAADSIAEGLVSLQLRPPAVRLP